MSSKLVHNSMDPCGGRADTEPSEMREFLVTCLPKDWSRF